MRCTNAHVQWSGLEFSYEDDQITVARGRVFSLAVESLNGSLTFTSSNPSVGTISSNGVYSALTAGTTTVSVSDGLGGSDSIVVSTPTTGLDTSFASGGYRLLNQFGAEKSFSIDISENQDIVVAGELTPDFRVALFDGGGNITSGFPQTLDINGPDVGEAVFFDRNGRIVVAGTSNSGFSVVRYLTDGSGSIDSNFNSGTFNTSGSSSNDGKSIFEHSDGSLIVGGIENGFNAEFSFGQFSASGSENGSSPFTQTRGIGERIYDIVAANNGNIVAVGSSDSALSIAQFDPGASFALINLDTFPAGTEARAVLRDDDGNIYAVGKDGSSLFVQKTDSSGNPLKSSSLGFPVAWDGEHVGAAMLPNGYIVMVAETNAGLALAMVTQNLDADAQFNLQGTTPGTMLVDLSGVALETATSVAIDTLGRIVVGGYAHNGTDNDFLVARFWP